MQMSGLTYTFSNIIQEFFGGITIKNKKLPGQDIYIHNILIN